VKGGFEQEGKGRDYKEFFLKWKAGMTMQNYDVIILPLAERDIAHNTDYIIWWGKGECFP